MGFCVVHQYLEPGEGGANAAAKWGCAGSWRQSRACPLPKQAAERPEERMPLTMCPDRALFSGREGLKGLHHLQKANGQHFAAIAGDRET